MTNVTVTPAITHADLGQLTVTLISPIGTAVVVSTSGATNTLAFNGEIAAGTWTLQVDDSVVGDTGTLDEWTLAIDSDTPAAASDINATAVAIPDATAGSSTSTITASPNFVVDGLTITTAITHAGPEPGERNIDQFLPGRWSTSPR